MTVKELSQLSYLNREIAQDKRRLADFEKAAAGTAVTLAGLPHIHCGDCAEKNAAQLAEIREAIEAKKQLCLAEYKRLMNYITDVDDSLMRQILTFRYVNGFSWVQVAMHIGGGNTEDSVRKAHKRFLDKQQ